MITGHDVQKAATLTGGATGAQAALRFQLGPKDSIMVQVDFSGTGSVQMEGRLSPEAAWRSLGSAIAASGIVRIDSAATEIRANVTSNSANTDVWVMG